MMLDWGREELHKRNWTLYAVVFELQILYWMPTFLMKMSSSAPVQQPRGTSKGCCSLICEQKGCEFTLLFQNLWVICFSLGQSTDWKTQSNMGYLRWWGKWLILTNIFSHSLLCIITILSACNRFKDELWKPIHNYCAFCQKLSAH